MARQGGATAFVAVAGLIAAMLATLQPPPAAGSPYQCGLDPTVASVAAASPGTWGAVAIVPGYTACFADEEARMGPWLSSFGFVVIGVETNSRTDYDTARGTQLVAALDYLTRQAPCVTGSTPGRLAVIGHSLGDGGAINASERRPSLRLPSLSRPSPRHRT
ncbi:hypothetical protein ACH47Z_46305 [Streptomyces sp. NPDC020192]|uniref:poly(ethylene terephthalate) hydrolase family protein n=1 Tax=Streptomyces sp. NPDC020192 TaxID=3365066 RepID=UPI0037A65BB7